MTGVSAPSPLAAAQRTARALRGRGDLAGARATLLRALEDQAAPPGEHVLETTRMLAAIHREMGDLAAARRTLEEAITAGQLSLGEQHPLMIILAYDLGIVAHEFGNRHEARRNLGAVAERGPAVLGPDHPAVWAAARYLDHDIPPPAEPRRPEPQRPEPQRPGPQATEPRPEEPRHERATRKTGKRLMFVAAAAAVALAAVVIAIAVPRIVKDQPRDTTSATPVARPAPTGVRLRDDGTSITLTWQDPAGGAVPFIVAGARAGEQSRPFADLPAGRTSYTVNGLNPRLQYCFTIVAVYSTEVLTPSELVCTRRNPQPSRS